MASALRSLIQPPGDPRPRHATNPPPLSLFSLLSLSLSLSLPHSRASRKRPLSQPFTHPASLVLVWASLPTSLLPWHPAWCVGRTFMSTTHPSITNHPVMHSLARQTSHLPTPFVPPLFVALHMTLLYLCFPFPSLSRPYLADSCRALTPTSLTMWWDSAEAAPLRGRLPSPLSSSRVRNHHSTTE